MGTRTLDGWSRELFLCATNEGSFYPRFLALARRQVLKRTDADSWSRAASDYLTHYRREMREAPPSGCVSPLARELESYYVRHVREFDSVQLADLDKRLGIKREPRLSFTYRGVVVFRKTEPGFALRYSARTDDGERLAGNTQAEIREAIRDALQRK